MSKKWLNATFLSFLIRCLRLWRGQHLMQGKPCYASAFCGFAAHPPGGLLLPLGAIHLVSPNPNKAIRGCGPLSTPGFFDSLKPPTKWSGASYYCEGAYLPLRREAAAGRVKAELRKKNRRKLSKTRGDVGAPGAIRTRCLMLRRHTLYPSELRAPVLL